jgi:hypothetical protein
LSNFSNAFANKDLFHAFCISLTTSLHIREIFDSIKGALIEASRRLLLSAYCEPLPHLELGW